MPPILGCAAAVAPDSPGWLRAARAIRCELSDGMAWTSASILKKKRHKAMNLARGAGMICLSVLVVSLSAGAVGLSQVVDRSETGEDFTQPQSVTTSKALRAAGRGAVDLSPPPVDLSGELEPDLSGATLAWIAVVTVLALTIQLRPWRTMHNLDALVLALAALLLAVRDDYSAVYFDPARHTTQWWSYALLTAIAGYWMLRGLGLMLARNVPAIQPNVTTSAMSVLVFAGVGVAIHTIATAPISDASRDGLIGGVYTAQTGKLPYGDAVGHDARSPLLYLAHAAAVRVVPPDTYDAAGISHSFSWEQHEQWSQALDSSDLTAARIVNGALFLLMFLGLAGIGHRNHSVALGQALVVMFCVFPGVNECLVRPDIMLPAALLTWAIATLRVPGVGGLLSAVLLTMAGVAWPWAWLGLPVLLAYWFRQGWHAFGATVGLLAGAAGIGLGITLLVRPALPQADGALAAAGLAPEFDAAVGADERVALVPHAPGAPPADWKAWFWKYLLNAESITLDPVKARVTAPASVNAREVRYRDIDANPAARKLLQPGYRAALAPQEPLTRFQVALRTVLEATWKPSQPAHLPASPAWALWAPSGDPHQLALPRRVGKGVLGALALFAAWWLLRCQAASPHNVIGALLMLSAGALIVSLQGPVTNLAWMMPTVLGAFALQKPAAEAGPRRPEKPHILEATRTPLPAAPRISIDE